MKYKLVCFDVDGTLIDNVEYSWQVFHDFFKVDPARREKAKNDYYSGKISYLDWANHDIGLWVEKKARKEDFIRAMEQSGLRLMPGAVETLSKLKGNGIKLAVISGSLNIVLEHFIPDFRDVFSDIYISWLYFDSKGNIEKVKATSYDMERKATALKEISAREGIPLRHCVFVGDHHNDVKAAEAAGLAIAFNCKDENLRKAAHVCIQKKDLRETLKEILC